MSYAFVMRDAHRKLHQPIKPPALSRHISYRRDESDSNESDWIDRIERLILGAFITLDGASKNVPTLISNLRQRPVACSKKAAYSLEETWAYDPVQLMRKRYIHRDNERIECLGEIMPDGSRYETVVITSAWAGSSLLLRFEVFEEYFTLSIILEFDRITRHNHQDYAYGMESIISKLNKTKIKRKASLRQKDPKFSALVAMLGDKVWKAFDEMFEGIVSEAVTLQLLSLPSQEGSVWRPESFADFRGFILGLTPAGAIATIDKDRPKGSERTALQFPERLLRVPRFKQTARRLAYVEMLFPLLLALEQKIRPHRLEISEYTWSTFEDCSVIYGSCLGQTGDSTESPSGTLTYVLLFAHDDYRSIGRVAGRLHTMGTARVAALLDFDRTMIRDQILSSLDLELSQIEETKTEKRLVELIERSLEASIRLVTQFSSEYRRRGPCLGNRYQAAVPADFLRHADALKAIQTAENSRRESGGEIAIQKIYPGARHEVLRIVSDIELIAKACQQEIGPDDEIHPMQSNRRMAIRHIKRLCRQIQRHLELIGSIRSLERFRILGISGVEHALQSMNERVKFGLAYRSERSKYHQETFESLAEAMDVGSIDGFQSYTYFVRHRLRRSLNMIASADAKRRSISARAADLRSRFDRADSKKTKEEFMAIQNFAELVLVFVIAPHYVIESLGIHDGVGPDWLPNPIRAHWGASVLLSITICSLLVFYLTRRTAVPSRIIYYASIGWVATTHGIKKILAKFSKNVWFSDLP